MKTSSYYIMVTSWSNHWDKLPEGRTIYIDKMMRAGMSRKSLKENFRTYFIRKPKNTDEPILAWIGTISLLNVKEKYKDQPAVSFQVNIESQIELNKLPGNYRSLSEGWYLETEVFNRGLNETIFDQQYFGDLLETKDWSKFEEYTYYLLKSLGIHEIFRFEHDDQRGKADGFFKFNTLAILYDCTLESDFQNVKKTQIENFCSQLKQGSIEHRHQKYDISKANKSVWIITRSNDQRLIKKIDDIQVKEVSIQKLLGLYRARLVKDMSSDALERVLREI